MKFENTKVTNMEMAIHSMRNSYSSWDKSDSAFGIADIDSLPDYVIANKWALAELKDKRPTGEELEDVEDAYHRWLWENGILDRQGDIVDYAFIGPADMKLAKTLAGLDASDGKFLRSICVSVDITAPVLWWCEADTYKVGTVRNSCSLQHKGMSRDYTVEDFTIDDITFSYDFEGKMTSKESETFWTETLEDELKCSLHAINECRQLYVKTRDYKYFRAMRQLMPMGYNYKATLTLNYAVLRAMYHQRKNHLLSEWSVDFCNWVKTLPYAKELIIGEE